MASEYYSDGVVRITDLSATFDDLSFSLDEINSVLVVERRPYKWLSWILYLTAAGLVVLSITTKSEIGAGAIILVVLSHLVGARAEYQLVLIIKGAAVVAHRDRRADNILRMQSMLERALFDHRHGERASMVGI